MLRSLRIENLVLIRGAELALAPGVNAVTGETGAGKTIFAHAVGLLLGARGDAAAIGPAGAEAFVEAELDVPEDFFEDEELAALAELRPEDEPGLLVARRIFADGRTRAYAWGRAVAREDLAAATERLIAMSGQFEQRRLARPAYQLDVLDGFCGAEQESRRRDARAAWRELTAARRRHAERAEDAGAAAARLEELRTLVAETAGLEAGEEEALRAERERLVHATELVESVAAAAEALAPDEGDGAAALAARSVRALEPAAALVADLEPLLAELQDLAVRLGEAGSETRRALDGLEADPSRLDAVESRLDRLADLRRRFRCESAAELVARRDAARQELDALDGGLDPLEAAARDLAAAERRFDDAAGVLHDARDAARDPFAAAVTAELAGLGLGEGEFAVELRPRDAGPSGRDEAVFQVRLNSGLPFAPVAETASGGELSRIALALAAAAAGGAEAEASAQTLVFDEIDAGIGGRTAHAVAETLARLGARAQVVTITHLPQIANVADAHFRVEKVQGDPATTTIERLSDEERTSELERMLGGEEFLATLAGRRDAG